MYTMKKEEAKKGLSLAYQFQQSMESGNASNEEAPPSNPKGRI